MGEAKRRHSAGIRLRRLHPPAQPRTLTKLVIPAGSALPARETAIEAMRIAETIRARVRGALVDASQAGSLETMFVAIDAVGVSCAGAFSDALVAAAAADRRRGSDMAGIACRRGCAFCCHVDIDVTPLEAIRLARRAPGAGAGARPSARRAPCPLLSDGACTQYDARPYACRAVFSPDAKACEDGFASDRAVSVPSLDWPRALASCYITGEIAALDDLKLASHMVELRRALAILDADADAALRWLNGADIFPRRGA
jgi:hypothetical protein